MKSNIMENQDQLLKAHLSTLDPQERQQFIKQFKTLSTEDRYLVLNEINTQLQEVESDPYMDMAQLGGMLKQYQTGGSNMGPSKPLIAVDEEGYYYNTNTGERVVLDGKARENDIVDNNEVVAGVVTTDMGTTRGNSSTALPATTPANSKSAKKRLSNSKNPNIKRSEQVKYLQMELARQGYTPSNSLIRGSGNKITDWDGIQGKGTINALKNYARDNGLTYEQANDELVGTIEGWEGRDLPLESSRYFSGLDNRTLDDANLETYNRNFTTPEDIVEDPRLLTPEEIIENQPYIDETYSPGLAPGYDPRYDNGIYREDDPGFNPAIPAMVGTTGKILYDAYRGRKRRGRTPDEEINTDRRLAQQEPEFYDAEEIPNRPYTRYEPVPALPEGRNRLNSGRTELPNNSKNRMNLPQGQTILQLPGQRGGLPAPKNLYLPEGKINHQDLGRSYQLAKQRGLFEGSYQDYATMIISSSKRVDNFSGPNGRQMFNHGGYKRKPKYSMYKNGGVVKNKKTKPVESYYEFKQRMNKLNNK